MRSQMATTSLSWSGKKASPPVVRARRLQHTRIPVRIVFVEDTYGVDDGAGLLGHLHDLGQAVRARVVAAVADRRSALSYPGCLPAIAPAPWRSRRRAPSCPWRVCSAIARSSSAELIGEADRAGQAQRHVLVEVDDEHLVFRIAGPHEGPGGGNHLREFRPHASAVVDNQSHGDRNIFVPEQPDALPHTVLVDLKILLAQIGDKPTLPVGHRGVQHHQVDVHRESGKAAEADRRLAVEPVPRCRQRSCLREAMGY